MQVELSEPEMNMIRAGLKLYMTELLSLKDDRKCVRTLIDEHIDQLRKTIDRVNCPNISLHWKDKG